MRINALNMQYRGYAPNNRNLNNKSPKTNNSNNQKTLAFTSIFADATPKNQSEYNMITMLDSNFSKLRMCATRIFRELPSEIAISKLLNPDKKSQINIFGCSDGSEAYAYAIILKEQMGEKAKENIKIKAIDYAPFMIDIAKTGKIVCSDIERKYASGDGYKSGASSPLKGDGWDKYLTKTKRPEIFSSLVCKYPFLLYMENDPIARKSIGNGLDWYEINQDELPEIQFEQNDMRKAITSSDEADAEVYVIANSGAYIIEKSPEDYIKLFSDIKEANRGKGKDVYVVVGDVENNAINPAMSKLLRIPPSIQNKIYKLED